MADTFTVKVNDFEGPLDLLLNLIEKRKLHINDVSLAQVADDYVIYLERLGNSASMDQMANFILVASTLMLIKSLSLLPSLSLTQEEQADIEELENRLKRYQRIKELAEGVRERFGKRIIFLPEPVRRPVVAFAPTKEITPANLLEAMRSVLQALPKKEIIPQAVVKKVISLEEVIGDLTNRVQTAIRLRFSDFVKDQKEKTNVIVSFLGMLELVKQGIVEVRQESRFDDIDIENVAPTVPRY